MNVVPWSVALVPLGLAASRWAATRLGPEVPPRAAWLVGVPAFLPAWLVAFVSLLGDAGSAAGAPRTAFLGASAAAILGVVASDWLYAREERRGAGSRPLVCWLLGAASLGPAWLVALSLAARLGR